MWCCKSCRNTDLTQQCMCIMNLPSPKCKAASCLHLSLQHISACTFFSSSVPAVSAYSSLFCLFCQPKQYWRVIIQAPAREELPQTCGIIKPYGVYIKIDHLPSSARRFCIA